MKNKPKYYIVNIKNINTSSNEFLDGLEIVVEESNEKLENILTGRKVYCAEEFNLEKYLETGATLYGTIKEEIPVTEVGKRLKFITMAYVRKQMSAIEALEQLTLLEIVRQNGSLVSDQKSLKKEK